MKAASLLTNFSYADNFLIFILAGEKFRRELRLLLCCNSRDELNVDNTHSTLYVNQRGSKASAINRRQSASSYSAAMTAAASQNRDLNLSLTATSEVNKPLMDEQETNLSALNDSEIAKNYSSQDTE